MNMRDLYKLLINKKRKKGTGTGKRNNFMTNLQEKLKNLEVRIY